MSSSEREVILKEIDRQINNLPPFSPIITKVLSVIDNPASSASDIERIIKYDQVLSSRVLKMANSAYYGYGGKISTISQSIVILGLNTLRAILFTALAAKALNKKLLGYKMQEGDFWKHSVLTALAARTLSAKIKYPNPEEVFIGGLLHDLGKLVLDPFVANHYSAIINLVNTRKILFSEGEREVLGLNHAHVGRRIAEKWNFPALLTEVIAFHHQSSSAPNNKTAAAIISLSTKFATYLSSGIDEKITPLNFEFPPDALDILKFQPQTLRELFPVINASFKDVSSFLGIN